MKKSFAQQIEKTIGKSVRDFPLSFSVSNEDIQADQGIMKKKYLMIGMHSVNNYLAIIASGLKQIIFVDILKWLQWDS